MLIKSHFGSSSSLLELFPLLCVYSLHVSKCFDICSWHVLVLNKCSFVLLVHPPLLLTYCPQLFSRRLAEMEAAHTLFFIPLSQWFTSVYWLSLLKKWKGSLGKEQSFILLQQCLDFPAVINNMPGFP